MKSEFISQICDQKDLDPSEYLKLHDELCSRQVEFLRTEKGDNWGDISRIRDFSLCLRQILLHRELLLFEGSIEALANENGYLMTLSIRGNFEATAALGYLHNRLNSLKNGTLDPVRVDQDIYTQILGARDKSFRESGEVVKPEAIQVMSMLYYADKSFSKCIAGSTAKKHKLLRESYEFLCEFCHPNFLSNSMAFKTNKKREVHFRRTREINSDELHLMGYLFISCSVFTALFDDIENIVNEI